MAATKRSVDTGHGSYFATCQRSMKRYHRFHKKVWPHGHVAKRRRPRKSAPCSIGLSSPVFAEPSSGSGESARGFGGIPPNVWRVDVPPYLPRSTKCALLGGNPPSQTIQTPRDRRYAFANRTQGYATLETDPFAIHMNEISVCLAWCCG